MQKELGEIVRTKCLEVIPPSSWLKLTKILFLLTLGLPYCRAGEDRTLQCLKNSSYIFLHHHKPCFHPFTSSFNLV